MPHDPNALLQERGADALRAEMDGARLHVPTGARLLDEIGEFICRFLVYSSDHQYTAHALWCAHAHRMDGWECSPRLLFTSCTPASGKTRGLEITGALVPRACSAFSVSAAYLVRRVAVSQTALPTILYDEIDALWGGKASERSEDVRAVINAGHRRGATIGRCRLDSEGDVVTEDLSAYCAVALAGLDTRLPDTITTRSIIIPMKKRLPTEHVQTVRDRVLRAQGEPLRERLGEWMATIPTPADGVYPEMPEGVADRDADVWEALLAVADAAGGDWPAKARAAARHFVVSRGDPSRMAASVLLLRDIRAAFDAKAGGSHPDRMWSEELVERLIAMPESPWGDLRAGALTQRKVANMLDNFDVYPGDVRIGNTVRRGYKKSAFFDAFARYLGS